MALKLKTREKKKVREHKNCLTCRYYIRCSEPKKSHKYRCVSWRQFKEGDDIASSAKRMAEKEIESYDIDFKFNPETKRDQGRKFEIALEQLLSSEATMATDIRVNDSEMPLAANFFEFCTDKRFLGIEPYAKQLEAGIHLFGDACPYCSDPDWYYDIPYKARAKRIKRKICLMEHGVCPSCKRNRADMIRKGKLKDYFELAGLAGQRSGKSLLVTMLSAYVLHYYLKVQNPALYFDQLPNTVFHGTFVGLTYGGAKELLYDPFYELIANSTWFQEYHELLRHAEGKLGEEVYKFKDTFLHYRHRNLMVYPQGPNKRSLRGRTRFLGGIDEIGWFDSSSKELIKLSAGEIYKSMNNSFETLRIESRALRKKGLVNIPKPMFLNISSPSSQVDMITQLFKRSLNSRRIYGFRAPTWEFNPKIAFDDLQEEFSNDPVGAWRDFGCEPALSKSPFISDISILAPTIKRLVNNSCDIKPEVQKSKNGRKMLTGRLKWNNRDNAIPKLMALDAGQVSNSFALTVAHNEIADNGEVTTIFDLMNEIIPSKKTPVSFTWLLNDVILPIARELNVQMVVADRWQSLKLLSDIEEELEIETEQFSVKYDDFVGFKNGINEGFVLFPRPKQRISKFKDFNLDSYPDCFVGKPIDHFIMQCLSVEDIPGKTVEKGDGMTDDIFRAAVLNHCVITQPDLYYQFSGNANIRSRGGIIAISDPQSQVTSVPGIGTSAGFSLEMY